MCSIKNELFLAFRYEQIIVFFTLKEISACGISHIKYSVMFSWKSLGFNILLMILNGNNFLRNIMVLLSSLCYNTIYFGFFFSVLTSTTRARELRVWSLNLNFKHVGKYIHSSLSLALVFGLYCYYLHFGTNICNTFQCISNCVPTSIVWQ